MTKVTAFLLLAAFSVVLAGCNTTRGVGQDIEAAGAKIEEVAEDAKDRLSDDEG